jgi:hypothetical protein
MAAIGKHLRPIMHGIITFTFLLDAITAPTRNYH